VDETVNLYHGGGVGRQRISNLYEWNRTADQKAVIYVAVIWMGGGAPRKVILVILYSN